MPRRLSLAGVILTALLLSGCGPSAPLQLSVFEWPTAVQYGAPSSSASPVPAPAAPPPAAPPALVPVPPPAELATPATTPPPACPDASPLAPVAEPASGTPASPPAVAAYAWRASGSYTSGGATVAFPATDTESVTNVTNPDSQGVFTYDVTNDAGGLDGREPVTTTYEVIPAPGGGTVGGTNTNQASGIYVTRVVTREPVSGVSLVFTPSPPIEYLAVPAPDTTSWTIDSTDTSATGAVTVERGTASLLGRGRVNACGTVLDAWEVHLDVSITSATQALHLVEDYDVGTEFGGIPLAVHDVSITGTDGGLTLSSTSSETIDVQPHTPS